MASTDAAPGAGEPGPARAVSPDVHLNLNVRGMGHSATVALNEHCLALRQQGREVFRLGLGQSPFPVPRPVVEELQANAWRKEYLAVQGLYELREAVANYYQRRHGLPAVPDHVLIGPGSKELMFLLQLVYYGDLVIPTPAWVSYAPQARIIGRQVRFVATRFEDGWKLTPGQVDVLCRPDPRRPRILVLNYPSNPTGRTYSDQELQALAERAAHYRMVVLSDEIYGELDHRGSHVSISRYYPEGTILSSGLSKWCGAGGWRLGTFMFPPSLKWLLEAMAAVASETYTTTSAPVQWAAVRAFEGGEEIRRYLGAVRRILAALGGYVHRRLEAAGLRVLPPEGGFYAFPDFAPHRESLRRRGIATSRALCLQLLDDTGVAILPGEDFGCPPSDLTARLAYVDFDGLWALAALETSPGAGPLGDPFVRAYCPRVVEAVERLCRWAAR